MNSKLNDPSTEAIEQWDQLKNLAGTKSGNFEDIVIIGLRSTESPEDDLIKSKEILSIQVADVQNSGTADTLQSVWQHLEPCDKLYISFDVDSLDPEVSVGTGTPAPGGLLLDEARDILLGLCHDPRVCCLEVTEINPLLDTQNKMAELSFGLLESAIQALLSSQTAPSHP